MVETVKRCEPDADRVPEAAERGGMCGAFFNLLEIGVMYGTVPGSQQSGRNPRKSPEKKDPRVCVHGEIEGPIFADVIYRITPTHGEK